ncbi:peptide chain release factor 1-like, mitochondrial [Euwallacea fornicatus]|uniref:peptide chain release factor 1-like, mitochondrial n=1 Tax=Euwallacea fornicatus TaxID=995702 RepID=UPI00338ED652
MFALISRVYLNGKLQFSRKAFEVIQILKLNSLKCLSFQSHFSNFYSTTVEYKYDLKINNIDLKQYISKIQSEYSELINTSNHIENPRYNQLLPVILILQKRENVVSNILSLVELTTSRDKELSLLAKAEEAEMTAKLKGLDDELFEALSPPTKDDSFDSIILEVQAGVGGQEAMLFAKEMFDMYCSFTAYKGWKYEISEYVATDAGGLRHGSISVSGHQVYKYFKHEVGVHRVQRVPATEKSGRIHTSTVSVTALPQPDEIDIKIEAKDLKIETKRSTGAGGQHVNTTDSAVRITHLPTNIAVECQVDRSQIKNRKFAMARLRALLYQRELDIQIAQSSATKKSQVRSNNRNEKIRTYNFNQDRITDHRLQGVHFHNLKGFINDGGDLDRLIQSLEKQLRINCLLELVKEVYK